MGRVARAQAGTPFTVVACPIRIDYVRLALGHGRDASGHTIGTLTDARKDSEGTGGVSLAALWLLLVR